MSEKCNHDCKNCYDLHCVERKEFPNKNIITNEIKEEDFSKSGKILLNE